MSDKFKHETRAYVLKTGLKNTEKFIGINNGMLKMQGQSFEINKNNRNSKGVSLIVNNKNNDKWLFHFDDLEKVTLSPPLPSEFFDVKDLNL